MWTDLEWRVVTGDLDVELVGDGGAVVLQGDEAEVSQAGGVRRVPGRSQNHQAGAGTTQHRARLSRVRRTCRRV